MFETKNIKEVNRIEEATIANILQQIEDDESVECHLPGGGYLQIGEPLPYMLVYRVTDPIDNATVRLVLSESSYLIIGNKDLKGYSNLIFSISEKLSTNFKSFLVFEIFTAPKGTTSFTIKGPADRIPTTFKMLQEELNTFSKKYDFLDLHINKEDSAERQQEDSQPLLSIEEAKRAGCLLLGLEIPPVYENQQGEEYPVFFRSFKKAFTKAIHKAIYDFIRVQTTSGAKSYLSLGSKKLKNLVFEIDRDLAEIERSYQFLWLVSPANIKHIKDTFFSSNYEKIEDYHYRLLPIDPDLLKRKLYSLKIEDVEDPAMSYIFREKREELDIQISMLNERGTKNFFYNSVRLYKGVEAELKEEALSIVENLQEETDGNNLYNRIDAQEFKQMAEKEFKEFQMQNPSFNSKVNIREDVNILMVSNGELLIPADSLFTTTEADALIQHEVGTHVLTYFNGAQQPLEQMAIGLADYDTIQEGLAVVAEYLVGGLTANRIRILAGRVLAGSCLLNGANFREIFDELRLKHGFSPEYAFNITSRFLQGGGFLKDVIYLRGLVQLREHLANGGKLEQLLLGKYALKHQEIIEELLDREVLQQASICPSYFKSEKAMEKLEKLRKGLPLSQMIEK